MRLSLDDEREVLASSAARCMDDGIAPHPGLVLASRLQVCNDTPCRTTPAMYSDESFCEDSTLLSPLGALIPTADGHDNNGYHADVVQDGSVFSTGHSVDQVSVRPFLPLLQCTARLCTVCCRVYGWGVFGGLQRPWSW